MAGTKAVGAATGRERVGAGETPEEDESDGTATLFSRLFPAFDPPEIAVGALAALELVVVVVAAGVVELAELEPAANGAAETWA